MDMVRIPFAFQIISADNSSFFLDAVKSLLKDIYNMYSFNVYIHLYLCLSGTGEFIL